MDVQVFRTAWITSRDGIKDLYEIEPKGILLEGTIKKNACC